MYAREVVKVGGWVVGGGRESGAVAGAWSVVLVFCGLGLRNAFAVGCGSPALWYPPESSTSRL